MTERRVKVKPKSAKAKNRLANSMVGNPWCVVEQDTGGELFLRAEEGQYFFWVATRTGTNRFGDKADSHWEIEEWGCVPGDIRATDDRKLWVFNTENKWELIDEIPTR
jgi:hypothetical protein